MMAEENPTRGQQWRRYINIDICREPAPATLAVANGAPLPIGTYLLSLEPVEGKPSAYRINDETEQGQIWRSTVHVFLPTRDGLHIRTAFGPRSQATRLEAYDAFNRLPPGNRSFTLYAAEPLIFFAAFDYRDNEGQMCVVITKID